MELLSDGKYIVFKVAEFEQMLSEATNGALLDEDTINEYAIPDSTVIRAQDIFSGAALYAYGTAVDVAIRVMSKIENTETTDKLKKLRDFFYERAEEAEKWEIKKLPD